MERVCREPYALDCFVIDDTCLKDEVRRSLEERLERFIYLGDDREIAARYVDGALLPDTIRTAAPSCRCAGI